MGQALCSCGGRADDDHALLFGAALAKAKLQHQQRFGGFNRSSPLTGKNTLLDQQHGSLYHSRGETNELSDDIYISAAVAGDDAHYYDTEHRTLLLVNRQSSALALAEAFRQKLAESPLGPHEKMQFLLAPRASSPTSPSAALAPDADAFGQFASDLALDDASEHVSEEDWKLRANPLVSIIVPPGPCGLVLQVDTAPGQPPVVDGFVRKHDGSKGVIENSGMVARGSVLCAINDIDVSRMALKEVVRTLNLSSHLERRFVFRDSATAARSVQSSTSA